MITTLLLQTMMAAETSRPGVALTSNSGEQTVQIISTDIQAKLQQLQENVQDLKNKGEETVKVFETALKDQSCKEAMCGSGRRIALTAVNIGLLAYTIVAPAIQFGFIEQDNSSPFALNNITYANAQDKFYQWSDAGKGIALSAFVSGAIFATSSLVQYFTTRANNPKASGGEEMNQKNAPDEAQIEFYSHENGLFTSYNRATQATLVFLQQTGKIDLAAVGQNVKALLENYATAEFKKIDKLPDTLTDVTP